MSLLIAITGATGFAGRHAARELQARGHRLRALVRRPSEAALPAGTGIIAGDVTDADAVSRLVAGADAVVHFAGVLSALRREAYFRVNAEATALLADQALAAGARRFVHVSSLAAREPGLSPYAASKRAGEDAILARLAGPRAVIIRPPAVYGPGDRATLPLIRALTQPLAAIPGTAGARFSLIHARDLARLAAMAAEGDAQGVHEVSDGRAGGYGWDDLIRTASAHRGAPVRPVFLPRAVTSAVARAAEAAARLTGRPSMINTGKIAELYHPDWVSRGPGLALDSPMTFAQGFAETVAWYREAGWLPRTGSADRTAADRGTP